MATQSMQSHQSLGNFPGEKKGKERRRNSGGTMVGHYLHRNVSGRFWSYCFCISSHLSQRFLHDVPQGSNSIACFFFFCRFIYDMICFFFICPGQNIGYIMGIHVLNGYILGITVPIPTNMDWWFPSAYCDHFVGPSEADFKQECLKFTDQLKGSRNEFFSVGS